MAEPEAPRQAVAALLHEYGLSRIAETIGAAAQAALSITSAPGLEHELATGQSKLGGMPDLPVSVLWPTWKDQPLSFLAQINLAGLPKAGFLNTLPASGLLSFFCILNIAPALLDLIKAKTWRVSFAAYVIL